MTTPTTPDQQPNPYSPPPALRMSYAAQPTAFDIAWQTQRDYVAHSLGYAPTGVIRPARRRWWQR